MLNALRIALLGLIAFAAPAQAQRLTIDQLSPGTTLSGSEKIPMYQGSNPAVTTTPGALTAYVLNNLGAGIDTNVPRTLTLSGNILATDCGKTLLLGTGSTGFFTLTVPATTGFSTTCSIKIVNGDTTNGKAIAGLSGIPGNMLWPGQAATLKIISNAWYWTEKPGAWVLTSGLTFNVDPVNGCALTTVPTCDGLGTLTDAFAAVQTAVSYSLSRINFNGQAGLVLLADGTYTEQVSCTGKFIGTTEITIQGASGHTAAVVWNVALSGAATGFFMKDYCALWLDNMTVNVANSAIGILTSLFGNVDVGGGIAFGSSAPAQGMTGTAIGIGPSGFGTAVGNFAVNGSFNYVVLVQGGHWVWGATTHAGASSLTWATAFQAALNLGYIDASSGSLAFSGFASVSGYRFALTNGSTLLTSAVNPNTVFAAVGSVNGTNSQSTQDSFQHTFATLPAGADGVFQINDGKASNCGDTSCTTFGTTVTNGEGALNLLVRWNGANWTLAGK
jgi:hypothetical protein